jgi:hypothetical protein
MERNFSRDPLARGRPNPRAIADVNLPRAASAGFADAKHRGEPCAGDIRTRRVRSGFDATGRGALVRTRSRGQPHGDRQGP